MAQSHAATILADQIKKWMRPYVVPVEILDNLTRADFLELRAISRMRRRVDHAAFVRPSVQKVFLLRLDQIPS